MKFIKAKDIVAISALLLVIILKYMGHGQGTEEFMTGIIGYYFGHRQGGVDTGN